MGTTPVATFITDPVASPQGRAIRRTLRGQERAFFYRINSSDPDLAADAAGLPVVGAEMPPPGPAGLTVLSVSVTPERGAARHSVAEVRAISTSVFADLNPAATQAAPRAYTEFRSLSRSVRVREAYNVFAEEVVALPAGQTLDVEAGAAEVVVHGFLPPSAVDNAIAHFLSLLGRHNANPVSFPSYRLQPAGSASVSAGTGELLARTINVAGVRGPVGEDPEGLVELVYGFGLAPSEAWNVPVTVTETETQPDGSVLDLSTSELYRPQGEPVAYNGALLWGSGS